MCLFYLPPLKQATKHNQLYAYITELKQEVVNKPNNPQYTVEFAKYLIIRKSSTAPDDVTLNVNQKM